MINKSIIDFIDWIFTHILIGVAIIAVLIVAAIVLDCIYIMIASWWDYRKRRITSAEIDENNIMRRRGVLK
jgi:hypothetical protein